MTDTRDRDRTFDTLSDRARSDPDTVSVADLVEGLRRDPSASAGQVRRAFESLAEHDPSVVPAAVDGLQSLARDVEDVTGASVALARLVSAHPDRTDGAVSLLVDAVRSDDPDVRDHAFHALASLAQTRPSAVLPDAVPVLREKLSADSVTEQSAALAVVAELARQQPAAVATTTPELLTLVSAEHEFDTGSEYYADLPDQLTNRLQEEEARLIRTRMVAALALVEIARADADAGADVVGTLIDLLPTEENLTVREATYDIVWLVGQERPAAVRSAVDPLAERLCSEDDEEIRGKIARALGILADEYADQVVPAVSSETPTLRELLDADAPVAVAGSVGLLSYVAEHRPDAVEPAVPRLQELALDGPTYVRGNAVWTLSFVGGDAAAETLERLALSAADEDIRAIANEARHRLD